MSELQTCRIVWTRHAEEQIAKRKKSKAGVEKAIRSTDARFPEKKGKDAVYGCVDGAWTKIILKISRTTCVIVTVIPRSLEC